MTRIIDQTKTDLPAKRRLSPLAGAFLRRVGARTGLARADLLRIYDKIISGRRDRQTAGNKLASV